MKSMRMEPATQCEIIQALIDFETIERLIALGVKGLAAELEDLHASMDADLALVLSDAGLDARSRENAEGDYLAHINDEYIELSELLPRLHSYSLFLIAYSFFERTLNRVCDSLRKHGGASLAVRDLAGNGISRARDYLVKVMTIEDPFEDRAWVSAKMYGEIRNTIAHANGYVEYRPTDIASLYSRLGAAGIELRQEIMNQPDAQILLTSELVLRSVETYKSLLRSLGGLSDDFVTPKHGLPGIQLGYQ